MAAAGVDDLTSALQSDANMGHEVDCEPENKLDDRADDEVLDGDSSVTAQLSKIASFSDPQLGLDERVLRALGEMSFIRPSKIQAISLPKINAGLNLLAQSHNGTGKTACFVIGMLRKCDATLAAPQAICLSPTRELGMQIATEVCRMGKYMVKQPQGALDPAGAGLSVKCVLAEEKYDKGHKLLDQIIVGTAGKVKSLCALRIVDASNVKVFALDEADQMIETNHRAPTEAVVKMLPKGEAAPQLLFFSATWSDEARGMARVIAKLNGRKFTSEKEIFKEVKVARQNLFNDQVGQYYLECAGRKEKIEQCGYIVSLLPGGGSTIIFVNTREAVQTLGAKLTEAGHSISMLSSGMPAAERDKVITSFKDNQSKIMITTNVSARGLDVASVTLVIQYDMPIKNGGQRDPETYLNRVGRTGRKGRKGFAIALISDAQEMKILKEIEVYFDRVGKVEKAPKEAEALEDLISVHLGLKAPDPQSAVGVTPPPMAP